MPMARSVAACAAILFGLAFPACAHLEAYTGREPSSAISARFSVELQQGDISLSPMVYESRSPDRELDAVHQPSFCAIHGGHFCNRTISWVEFGQDAGDSTTVVITRLDAHQFPADIQALPLSYGLSVALSAAGQTATVSVPGQRRHIMLRHGPSPSSAEDASFAHSLLIFVGGRDPVVSDDDKSLVFGPGVHHFADKGIQQIPSDVSTVVLQRGAWVEGRLNVTQGEGAVSILGHGIMEGSRFKYHGSDFVDDMRFVEVQYDRPLVWDGVTLVRPQGHALFVPPNSEVKCFRMLGWLFNEDGIWIGPNTTLSDSFLRTNDDSIRFYAGALDDYDRGGHVPAPPRGEQTANVRVENVVVAQSFNGAVIQFGWEDAGIVDSIVDGLDVIGAEWYWDMASTDATQRTNNAIIDLKPPEYDVEMTEHHRNLTVRNVRVDVSVGRLIGLGFQDTPGSSVSGFSVQNVTMREPLQWLQTDTSKLATPGYNFIIADLPDTITGVSFHNVCVVREPVLKSSDWGMFVNGSGTEDVAYSNDGAFCGTAQIMFV